MQIGRFLAALALFLILVFSIPLLARVVPDHTRTFANAGAFLSRAYIDRVVNYTVSGKKAYLVVAGSSLVVFPHVLTDGYYEHVQVPVPDPFEYAEFLRKYLEMAHFKKMLAQSKRLPDAESLSIVDLGVPSLMLSDCHELFQKLQDNQALPSVVVLFLAPRDFMDNTISPERNLFKYEINGKISTKELFNSDSSKMMPEKLVNSLSYETNSWARRFRVSGQRVWLAARKLGKPPRNELAGNLSRDKALEFFYLGNGRFADLALYKKRYNPPDFSGIKRQMAALDSVLQYLKAQSIKTIVVSMPITNANRELIDRTAYSEVTEGMKQTCDAHGVQFISTNELGTYSDADFIDSVHLNAPGGDKLFRHLAEAIRP